MTRIRQRLPLETHHAVFEYLHKLLAKHKLFSGKFLGVDSSTMEANASLKAIVRRDTGENYQEMLKRLAKESGIETPTAEQLIALDKKRQGKTLSNKEWLSQTDEDARRAKLKDGRTYMAYKPEHVVDLETGAIVSVSVHRADCGDTKTIEASLEDRGELGEGAKQTCGRAGFCCAERGASSGGHCRQGVSQPCGTQGFARALSESDQRTRASWDFALAQ